MNTRKKFPILGVYAVRGGIAGTFYLNDHDRRRYRFVQPSSYVQPTAVIGDCWIVDRHGKVNPGTNVSPVPFGRSVIGRRISASSAREHGPPPVLLTNACPADTVPDRLALIHRVLAKAHDECESWRDNFLGVQLAYLALAIAEEEPGFVDWSPEIGDPDLTATLALFRQWFPPGDPVWDFIRAG
jgi:hypothetical protein